MHAASERAALDSTSIARQLLLPSVPGPVYFIASTSTVPPFAASRPSSRATKPRARFGHCRVPADVPLLRRAVRPSCGHASHPPAAPLVSLAATARGAFDGVNIWLRPH